MCRTHPFLPAIVPAVLAGLTLMSATLTRPAIIVARITWCRRCLLAHGRRRRRGARDFHSRCRHRALRLDSRLLDLDGLMDLDGLSDRYRLLHRYRLLDGNRCGTARRIALNVVAP